MFISLRSDSMALSHVWLGLPGSLSVCLLKIRMMFRWSYFTSIFMSHISSVGFGESFRVRALFVPVEKQMFHVVVCSYVII